jgi:hypothetical protein
LNQSLITYIYRSKQVGSPHLRGKTVDNSTLMDALGKNNNCMTVSDCFVRLGWLPTSPVSLVSLQAPRLSRIEQWGAHRPKVLSPVLLAMVAGSVAVFAGAFLDDVLNVLSGYELVVYQHAWLCWVVAAVATAQ